MSNYIRSLLNKSVSRSSCNIYLIGFVVLLSFEIAGCKKLVAIDPPVSSITREEVFADSANAASAIEAIYTNLISQGNNNFSNSLTTIFVGLSSDELINFNTDPTTLQFYYNSLLSTNSITSNVFWSQPYSYIYQANACIEGAQGSNALAPTFRDQLIGEAKFLRAFIYFYLTNMFGNVPYVTSTAWAHTDTASRISKAQIYSQIIADLNFAQKTLPSDYSSFNGERIRATKWAATALLARAYLYTEDWRNAENQANSIISNTSLFSLNPDLNQVFSKNNSEAILQWNLNTAYQPYNATPEGDFLIPYDSTSHPSFYISPSLLGAFEAGDMRKTNWIGHTNYSGTDYYYPYKYKVGPAMESANAPATEYYMVFRLAEQYLIRAEARAEQNNIAGAILDVDTIRSRAGLPNIVAGNQTDVLTAIAQERRIELFAEWGQRWFDLKRVKQVDAVMSTATRQKGGTWNTYSQLYPIPLNELRKDPFLVQNPGY